MLNKKLKAGALQYTIFVSVLILLIVSAFISLTYLHQKLRIKATFFEKSITNTNNGFEYYSTNFIAYNDSIQLNFENDTPSNTKLSKKSWGVYDIVTSKSNVKNDHFKQLAFTGGQKKDNSALYLRDINKPLVLVGNTKIQGNVALPKQGVKRGNIAGNAYYNSQLIYGNIGVSKSNLPQIINKNQFQKLFNDDFYNSENIDLNSSNNFINSFENKTKVILEYDTINLEFVKLTGNFIITSKTKIIVNQSAVLSDVILIAPIIEIGENVTGNFQAFASDKITLSENSQLDYPSALVLYSTSLIDKSSSNQNILSQISLEKGSKISGAVIYLKDLMGQQNFKAQLILSENATIKGEVYCEGNFELKGSVFGKVYTNQFVATQFGSVYVNHIYNGAIQERKLPDAYCGLQFENSKNKIAKWLY